MKKMLCFVIAILTLLSSTAYANEILFRGIPWESTPMEFEKALFEEGTYFDDCAVFDSSRYTFLKSELDSSFGIDPRWHGDHLPFYTRYMKKDNEYVCIAASYEIDAISAQFLPFYTDVTLDPNGLETARLHEVTYVITSYRQKGKIINKEVVFFDLVDRLTEIYGESQNKPLLDMPIARYWIGDNGECVILQPINFDKTHNAIHIVYRSGITRDYMVGLVNAYDITMNTEGGL